MHSETLKLTVDSPSTFGEIPHGEWLHRAIIETANAATLQPDDGVRELVADHLSTLVQQYRTAYLSRHAAPLVPPYTENAPWYPDSSGKWIEVPEGQVGRPEGLADDTVVAILTAFGRRKKQPQGPAADAEVWCWNTDGDARIVAYKVVKPYKVVES